MAEISGWHASVAYLPFDYTDENDLRSLRRYMAGYLSPETISVGSRKGGVPAAGHPYVYYNPDPEGQFLRPSITIRLVTTAETLPTVRRAYASSYFVRHSIAMLVYGDNTAPDPRAATMALATRTFDLLNGGDPAHPPWRIPLFHFEANVKLARFMRLLPGSLSMGLDDTDDLSRWYRPIEMQLDAPRTRGQAVSPTIQTFAGSITVV